MRSDVVRFLSCRVHDVDSIPDEFNRYVQREKTLALSQIYEEEKLGRGQWSAFVFG